MIVARFRHDRAMIAYDSQGGCEVQPLARRGWPMRHAGRLLASMIFAGFASIGSAVAAPVSAPGHAPAAFDPVLSVQYTCDQNRCLNPRTGAYTYSNCNARGCYPSSGVVGYIDVPGARGGGRNSYDRPRYRDGWDDRPRYRDDWDDRPRRRASGGFDCNQLRCIELDTGRVWESTCNRGGCSPLRPARRQGGGNRW